MMWHSSEELDPVLSVEAVAQNLLILCSWNLQRCLWSRARQGSGEVNIQRIPGNQPYQVLLASVQKWLWIYVFPCHAFKFKSEVRHVLIFPTLHHFTKADLKGPFPQLPLATGEHGDSVFGMPGFL